MSENPLFTSPRHPGAQPGNSNALRHGFYAKNLGLESPNSLSEKELRNLLGEAAMLKDFMFKLYTQNAESTDSAVIVETLRALSMAGMALSRLLEVHCRTKVYESEAFDNIEDRLRSSLKSLSTQLQQMD